MNKTFLHSGGCGDCIYGMLPMKLLGGGTLYLKSKNSFNFGIDNYKMLESLLLQQNFIKEVLEQFEKENMGILTDMTVYQTNLLQFQQNIFLYSTSSWFNTYMDKNNPIVLKDTGEDRFIFLKSNLEYKVDAENKLKGEIERYKNIICRFGHLSISR